MPVKKIQWNFKDVPADVYQKIINVQAAMKIAGKTRTSIEQICYALIRKGANMEESKVGAKQKENFL